MIVFKKMENHFMCYCLFYVFVFNSFVYVRFLDQKKIIKMVERLRGTARKARVGYRMCV